MAADAPIGNTDMGPFSRHMGMHVTAWHQGRATVEMPIRPEFLNRSGVLHGGILTTLIDSAGGYAGTHCTLPGRIRRAFTLSLTTQFTGQASKGVICAKARLRGSGRKIFFADVEVFDDDGQSIAFGSATYRYRTGHEDPQGVVTAS